MQDKRWAMNTTGLKERNHASDRSLFHMRIILISKLTLFTESLHVNPNTAINVVSLQQFKVSDSYYKLLPNINNAPTSENYLYS